MNKTEKRFLTLILLVLFVVLINMAWDANGAERHSKKDVGLWLARSCVGEAGFDAVRTGECAAILNIYKKRAAVTGLSIYKVVRRYSAAVKPGANHNRKWVLGLSRDLKKPAHWGKNLRWHVSRDLWGATLDHCDDFLAGKVPDPLPMADHYGGRMDRHLAMREGWHRLRTNYRNEFWSVKNPKRKVL